MVVQGINEAFSKQKFKLNIDANYSLPTDWNKNIKVDDVTILKIYVNEQDSFQARNLNVFTNYVLTFYNTDTIDKWRNSCNMSFYQNQLNFTVWCASSGCGVSLEHLNSPSNLLSSVFKFHIYYQVRKLLQEMSCPIPGESIFKPTDNSINMIKYQKLCNEFNMKPNTDFRFKGGDNGGLGTMYDYVTRIGYRPLKGETYDPSKFQFIEQTTEEAYKIDYVYQNEADQGWKQFMLATSTGFTRPGVVRIDDSIRTYAYCILGSQAQTRSSVLSSLETQQNFVDLLESSVKSLFSIPESIEKYQNAVTNTNARINYVIGPGLYMIPSDLVLKVGSIEKYNNNLLIANDADNIGENRDANKIQPLTIRTPFVSTVVPKPIVTVAAKQEPISSTYIGLGISIIALTFLMFYAK